MKNYDLSYYDQAVEKYNAGNYEEALKQCNRAIEEGEDAVNAYWERAVILMLLKRTKEAFYDLEKVKKMEGETASYYTNRGIFYYQLGSKQMALEDYANALKLDKNFALAYLNRGILLKNDGLIERALKEYNQVIILEPNTPAAYELRGELYLDREQYKEAKDDFHTALHLGRNTATLYQLLGRLYGEIGELKESLDYCNKALELKSELESAIEFRGLVSFNMGEYQQAFDDLHRLAQKSEVYAVKYYDYAGRCLYHLKNYKEAMIYLNQAIQIDQKNIDAYSFRGECYFQLGNYEEAFRDFNKAIQQDGSDANQYNDRGRSYRQLHEYENARKDFERAIELEADHPYVWGHLGELYIQLGDREKAMDILNQALIINPEYEKAILLKKQLSQEIDSLEDYGSIQWFCLYELEIPGRIYPQHLLMRLEVPEVSNNNYKGQDLGRTIAECKREIILSQVMGEWKATKYQLVGYCECSPEGDEFYAERGKKWIDFWTFETKYYRPYMIFVQAANIDDVYNIMDEESNDDWASLNPIYPAKQCTAWLVTEGDYLLSSQAVINQCIEWTNEAVISSVFTYNYVFYDFLLEKGWYFDKVYSYQELLMDAPVMATFERKRVPWQGKIAITFYSSNRHLSFISITEDHGQERKVGYGIDFADLDELKCILDYVYYHQEILNSDYKEFLKKLLEEDIQVYWEVNGLEAEAVALVEDFMEQKS
ncbi:MAG TPA: tetratricopeptide repeat protein [Lachnospiraceae bacterium]|nr:tetratricopeptide repeat protein [Lachnospiraceae bacterium]